MNSFFETLKNVKEKIIMFFKEFGYSTLTEENLEKIIKKKEQEIKDIDLIMEKENEKIYYEMLEELSDFFSEEEIGNIYKSIIEGVKNEE